MSGPSRKSVLAHLFRAPPFVPAICACHTPAAHAQHTQHTQHKQHTQHTRGALTTVRLVHEPCVQVNQILRLPGEAAVQVLHDAYRNLYKRPLLVRSSCHPILHDDCAARDLPRILHPVFLKGTVDALLPLAVQSIDPEGVRCHHLHFPHMKNRYAGSVLAAAATIPHLTSLDLNLTCRGCKAQDLVGRTTSFSRSGPVKLPASLESLRINYAAYDGPSSSCIKLMALVSQALLDAVPNLTRLELSDFHSKDHDLATLLPPFATRLRCLHLPRCDLFMEQSDTHASSWLGILSTLCAVEDLDLSGNWMSRQFAGKLVAALSHLPLRRIALTDCGLEIVSTLARLHTEQRGHRADPDTPARAASSLRELDLSRNAVESVPKTGRLQPLLGRLTMLGLKDLTCGNKEGARSLLRELRASGADMREFRFGIDAPTAGFVARMQRCLTAWPRLRVLRLHWKARVELSTLFGKDMAVYASGLEELSLQGMGGMDADYPAAQLPLLTKLVVQRVSCSLQGERGLGAWLGEVPSLQVLRIFNMNAGHESGAEPQPGRLFQHLTLLTRLRELRVPAYVTSCGVFEFVTLQYLQPLAGVLRQLTGLTCLDVRAPCDFGMELAALSGFLGALSALVGLEELQLHRLPLDKDRGDAVGKLGSALRKMPRLAVLQLVECLNVESLNHLEALHSCLPDDAVLLFQYTSVYVSWDSDPSTEGDEPDSDMDESSDDSYGSGSGSDMDTDVESFSV